MNQPVPWRNHLPALAELLLLAGLLALGSPWPEPLADGFDARGRPIHWRWAPAALGAAVTVWLVAFAFDAVWYGVERHGRRRFNPLSLIDELFIGWQLVRLAGFAVALGRPRALEPGAWISAALALAAAVWLEWRREPAPQAERPPSSDASGLVSELDTLPAGARWSYWSVQKAPHRVLFGALGSSFVAGAALIPDTPAPFRLLLLLSGLLVLTVCAGGLRTVVTPQHVVLQAGFGLPLLRLRPREIAHVAVPSFDPLRDLGGVGIRRGLSGELAGAWAFTLAGAGVLVSTRNGRRYLIGTDEPERLAAALNAAREAA